MTRTPIHQHLAQARRSLKRLDPHDVHDALRAGTAVIDIRTDSQIARDGAIPGALVFPRNVLEWRLDPASEDHDPCAPALGDPLIVVCDAGYQSSLAGATLQRLGFARATDLDGGFQAWRAAGLPVVEAPGSAGDVSACGRSGGAAR